MRNEGFLDERFKIASCWRRAKVSAVRLDVILNFDHRLENSFLIFLIIPNWGLSFCSFLKFVFD
jgi:hypothetical protein